MLTVFLTQLAAGCLAMVALCRTDHVSWKYFRLMAIVSAVLLATAMAAGLVAGARESSAVQSAAIWQAAALGLCSVLLGFNSRQGERPRSTQRLAAAAGALAAFVAAGLWGARRLAGPAAEAAAQLASTISIPPETARWGQTVVAVLMLGSTTAAMLLGHAYLTQTMMPIDPLRRLAKAVAGAVAAGWLWCAVVLTSGRGVLMSPPGDEMWLWLMLSIRVGVGLIGAAVLAYMVWDCVKRRSTQSATGILYILMFFTFLGVLSATELGRTFSLWM